MLKNVEHLHYTFGSASTPEVSYESTLVRHIISNFNSSHFLEQSGANKNKVTPSPVCTQQSTHGTTQETVQ